MKKLLPLLLSLVFAILGGSLLFAFTVPGPAERKKAVGSLLHLAPELKAAFEANDDFQPMPKPGSFDWLSTHPEPGQTYAEFLQSRPNRPGAGGRKLIYLQPIGEFPDDAPQMATLQKYMEAYFHPMEVKVAPAWNVEDLASVSSRGNQLNCTDLLDVLQARLPQDAYVVMGVTMQDLYPGPEWNFVFGMARIKKHCGVFSFARYGMKEDKKRALLRALKVISHETGHAFGIRHCTHFHCLMNGSNSLAETDRAPLHFCPACLRKIHWGLRFEPAERYQKLGDFLKANELKKESEWFVKRSEMTK